MTSPQSKPDNLENIHAINEKTHNIDKEIRSLYKKNNFKAILDEVKLTDTKHIQSKEILFIIALAYDQTALKEKRLEMKKNQKIAKNYASIITKRFPSWDKGYFVKGLILQHSGNIREALRAYKQAWSINPNNTSYYLSLGNGYRASKNYKMAEHWYKKAIKIKKIKHLAYVNLVSLYEEIEKQNLVLKYAKETLKLLKNKKDKFSLNQKDRMINIIQNV